MKRKALTFGTLGVVLSLAITGGVYAAFIFSGADEGSDASITTSIQTGTSAGTYGTYTFRGGAYNTDNGGVDSTNTTYPMVTVDQLWYYTVPTGGSSVSHDSNCPYASGYDTAGSILPVVGATTTAATAYCYGCHASVSLTNGYTDLSTNFEAVSYVRHNSGDSTDYCIHYDPSNNATLDIQNYGPYSQFAYTGNHTVVTIDDDGRYDANGSNSVEPWQVNESGLKLYPTKLYEEGTQISTSSTYSYTSSSFGTFYTVAGTNSNGHTIHAVYDSADASTGSVENANLLGYTWEKESDSSAETGDFYFEVTEEMIEEDVKFGYYCLAEGTGTDGTNYYNSTSGCDCDPSSCSECETTCSCDTLNHILIDSLSSYNSFALISGISDSLNASIVTITTDNGNTYSGTF